MVLDLMGRKGVSDHLTLPLDEIAGKVEDAAFVRCIRSKSFSVQQNEGEYAKVTVLAVFCGEWLLGS